MTTATVSARAESPVDAGPPPRSSRYGLSMAHIRLFASAREAAGRGADEIAGATVGDVLDGAVARYGHDFGELLTTCRVWRNGEPAERTDPVDETDEVAVLPPVSGGAGPRSDARTPSR